MFDAFTKNTLVPLVIRAGLAVIFIYHGLHKVTDEGKQFGANWMQGEGAQPAAVQMAVAWGELVGGIAMAVGFLVRLAALGLIAIMAGAIYKVHMPNGFSILNHGYEYNFAIIILCLAAFLLGGGTLAADRVFRLRRRPVVNP